MSKEGVIVVAKRLLVCDFDGTIELKDNKRHMGDVMKKLNNLADDVVFAVASGRPLHLIKPYFKDCFIISNDGALITFGNRIIYKNPIDVKMIDEFCKNKEWAAYGECISYLHTKNKAQIVKWKKIYRNHAVEVSDLSDICEDIYKIFFTDKIIVPKGLKKCYASYGLTEFTADSADKGRAVLALSQMLNINKEDITTFGDGENDIPMFEVSGRSFAYCNASPNVRAKANAVYTDLKEQLTEFLK